MRSTEILDEALRAYRMLAPALLRRSAVPAVFVLASVLFWTRAFGPRLFTTTAPNDAAAQVGEAGFVLAVGLLVAGPLLVFGVVEATLQAAALVTPFREGRKPDEVAASAAVRAAFPRAFGAGLLAFLVAGAVPVAAFGFMALGGFFSNSQSVGGELSGLFAIVGILGMMVGLIVSFWAVGAYALVPAAALRGDGARDACRRSVRLMKGVGSLPGGYGTVWSIYLVMAVVALAEWGGIAMARSLIPETGVIPGGGAFSETLSLAVPFVIAWTLLPFWGTAVAVIDGERRVRKEGYDVELLAKG